MPIRTLSWNLYHGRDHPPDPALSTWRSRLLRLTERGPTHIQVNRDLRREFSGLLSGAEWDVALLQECPPRWAAPLAAACEAAAHRTLTSRNSLAFLRGLAARLNPDLIASNEGGSNLILVRLGAGRIIERRDLGLRPRGRPEPRDLGLRSRGRPERRALGFVRIRLQACAAELCVGNLHASAGAANRALAEAEVRLAAARAAEWARGSPLILGGDFNLRPAQTQLYEELEATHGLAGTTAPGAIDHLLARGLDRVSAPRQWRSEEREAYDAGRAMRLSDHAPVEAAFELARSGPRSLPATG